VKKEQIEDIIDEKIGNKFSTGSVVNLVIRDLNIMINSKINKNKSIVKDYKDIEWDSIENARIKFDIHYIRHCEKRISDMNWISKKREQKISINYWELWRLLKFRELMSDSIK